MLKSLRKTAAVILGMAFCLLFAVALVGCGGSTNGDAQGGQADQPAAPTLNEVRETPNFVVEGIYVNKSYKSSEKKKKKLKLVYLFATVKASEENMQVGCTSMKMNIGPNEYEAEHYPKAADYVDSYFYTSYLEDVYTGDSLKILYTFLVPKGDLKAGKEITLSDSHVPGIDGIKLMTDSIVTCKNAKQVAKKGDPKGYAKEVKKFKKADSAKTQKVRNALNGYYWNFYPTIGTKLMSYRIEFSAPNRFVLTTSLGATSGTYTVLNGYLAIKNTSNGYVTHVPYKYKNGEVEADFGTAYGTLE